MGGNKKLDKRQREVIEDLFGGELDEQAVLAKHGVSRNLFNRWLAEEHFRGAFDERIASAYRQSEIILARYAPLAAAKLVQLTESENQETARKACLDIIEREDRTQNTEHRRQNTEWRKPSLTGEGEEPPDGPAGLPGLSDETASRILAMLAEQEMNSVR